MPGKGWTVSHSAPGFFPKDEQDEKDNLSEEERQFIENELHGIPVFDYDKYESQPPHTEHELGDGKDDDEAEKCPPGSPTFLQLILQEMDECLNWLEEQDPELTREYQLAVREVPRLVRRETPHIMFLRAELYDVEGASRRLAMYWKERLTLFGPDRAFRPMTILPTGALGCDPTDMEQLMLGYVARIPDDDEHGRPVIWLDRAGSTKSPTYQRDCWLRVMWYLVQDICRNEEYQKSGYVVIINLKDYDPTTCGDRLGAKKMFLYVRECWCPRFKGYHATYSSRQTPVKLVEPAVRQLQGRHIRLHLRNHYGFDSENIRAMEKYGLTAKHVSTTIGGTFTTSDHLAWVNRQKQLEEEMEEKWRKEEENEES